MRYDCSNYLDSYLTSFGRYNNNQFKHGTNPLPSMRDIKKMEDELVSLFFPGHAGIRDNTSLKEIVGMHLEISANLLYQSIYLSLAYENSKESERNLQRDAKNATDKLLTKLPEIRAMLKLDAEAGFVGDPAAKSIHEVILCYPSIRALIVHRIAHILYEMEIPLIPRMMNEIVHSQTGIDIHPGATIGESFFIDHGTGVVIGETTVIKDHVKLYQGVTLGALSFPKDGCGMLLRGAKRHPTIEDYVTIYSNASILGDITIGEHSTIASSAWIKENIPPYSRVTTQEQKLTIKEKQRLDLSK